MSFDEETEQVENTADDKAKPKTFFGLEMSDGVVYTIVNILTLVFVRQVSVVIQALN